MIISGGENIYSAEVENALMSHPAVLQCAVIGVPDPKWGEAVHAYVQLRNDATTTTDDLHVHGQSLIANYKCQKSFPLLYEPLPMFGVGKVQIGRASCRERVCKYVENYVVAVSCKTKNKTECYWIELSNVYIDMT